MKLKCSECGDVDSIPEELATEVKRRYPSLKDTYTLSGLCNDCFRVTEFSNVEFEEFVKPKVDNVIDARDKFKGDQ